MGVQAMSYAGGTVFHSVVTKIPWTTSLNPGIKAIMTGTTIAFK
jgi:hypothetical protein